MDDFLRRHYPHQVKGSKFGYFLSARVTSSPVFCCRVYSTPFGLKLQEGVSIRGETVLYWAVELLPHPFRPGIRRASSLKEGAKAPSQRGLPPEGG